MEEVRNNDVEIQLRHYRNELTLNGQVMIFYAAWSVIKLVLQVFFGEENINTIIEQAAGTVDRNTILLVLVVIMIPVVAIAFGLHLLAGIGAYREGKGVGKGRFYLPVVYLLLVNSVLSILGSLTSPQFPKTIPAALLDCALIFLCIDLIHSAYQVRKLKKQINQTAEGSNER